MCQLLYLYTPQIARSLDKSITTQATAINHVSGQLENDVTMNYKEKEK